MVVKFLAFGFRAYFTDNFNSFDCFIIALSIVDIGLSISNLSNYSVNLQAVLVFRGLRLFRVFKLAKNWKTL